MLGLSTKFSGNGQRAVVTGLNDALKDEDFTVRAWSAQALGTMGSVAVPAVPALLSLLRESDWSMRHSVCLALAKMGPAATEALPELRRLLLNDPDARVRGSAQQALDVIDRPK